MQEVDLARTNQTNHKIKNTILESNMGKYNKQFQSMRIFSNVSNVASTYRRIELKLAH